MSDDRRLTRRVPIDGAIVDIEHPPGSGRHQAVFAVDVNADGLRLMLPPEILVGERIRLTFQLDRDCRLGGVIASVLYHSPSGAGLRFVEWQDETRLALLEFLDRRYRTEG